MGRREYIVTAGSLGGLGRGGRQGGKYNSEIKIHVSDGSGRPAELPRPSRTVSRRVASQFRVASESLPSRFRVASELLPSRFRVAGSQFVSESIRSPVGGREGPIRIVRCRARFPGRGALRADSDAPGPGAAAGGFRPVTMIFIFI
jgi:hypothetical protein